MFLFGKFSSKIFTHRNSPGGPLVVGDRRAARRKSPTGLNPRCGTAAMLTAPFSVCILSDFKKLFSAFYRNLDIFTSFVSTI